MTGRGVTAGEGTAGETGAAGTPPVVAVVGATATGKSDLAVELALRWDAEIVNADASQLYRGMDIGTAKLPGAARRGITHHQLDVLDIAKEASVAAYQRHARADLDVIARRGHRAVMVGGSGLYLRAALDRLDIPPTDPAVRAALEAELARFGVGVLRARLEARDPQGAAAIEPRNARRIVRALEVIELTGRPFSATMPTREFHRPTVLVGLRLSREVLDERIELRTRRMWQAGLIDEVGALMARGLEHTRTAGRAVGYPQAMAQLRGELTEQEAFAATVQATRRLVRRQESWFGADPRVRWIDVAGRDLHSLSDQVAQLVEAGE